MLYSTTSAVALTLQCCLLPLFLEKFLVHAVSLKQAQHSPPKRGVL
jgi:hypothetical protein